MIPGLFTTTLRSYKYFHIKPKPVSSLNTCVTGGWVMQIAVISLGEIILSHNLLFEVHFSTDIRDIRRLGYHNFYPTVIKIQN